MTKPKVNLAENQYQLDIGATWVFTIEWAKQLIAAGSTISTATWSLDSGLDEVDTTIEGTKTKIKVKASVSAKRGIFYRASCNIETNDVPPLDDTQSLFIEFIDQ
jgi:hypothetical protein